MNKKGRDEESRTEIIKLKILRSHLLDTITEIIKTIEDKSLSDKNVRAIIDKTITSNLIILNENGLLFMDAPMGLKAHE